MKENVNSNVKKDLLSIFIAFLFALVFINTGNLIAADTLKINQKQINVINPVKELQNDIEGIIDNPDFASALVGLEIRSCESGEFIFRKNASKNCIPASCTSLSSGACSSRW